MEKHEFEIVALNPGATLYYLTGLSFHLMERPVVLFVQKKGPSSIVLPELEEVRLAISMRKFSLMTRTLLHKKKLSGKPQSLSEAVHVTSP
jgi:hypothetical protein